MSSRPRRGDSPIYPFSDNPSPTAAASHDLDLHHSLSVSLPLETTNHSPSILELIGLSDGFSVSKEGSPAISMQDLEGDSAVLAVSFGQYPPSFFVARQPTRPFHLRSLPAHCQHLPVRSPPVFASWFSHNGSLFYAKLFCAVKSGITGDRPQEEFTFVAASGEIDERVIELSNHALVGWEIGLPDDREKVDIHRFAEDFERYFNVHSLDIQVTKFHPEDFLVNKASSQTQGSIAEEGESQGKQVVASGDFNAKLDDFIKQVSVALPQPILTTPQKKLTTLFKQPIIPSAVKAIKELVSFGEERFC
ncbi:hypothetical protein GUJ93_ZPchr0012g21385 [Zizania palustris]|uniref:Uncharacterized protein n=1 Tax=Zizania palustris TaxID=103762 RepID=A0A8J5WQ48_ZIZPA|nr:hypothetical protein GUJ93_ZPchr0012g21385 [Zizania palustris]